MGYKRQIHATSVKAPLHASTTAIPPQDGFAEWIDHDGTRIRLGIWPQTGARGLVVVAPGRTEFIEKYYEVVRRLRDRRFSIAVIDWRGQGLSDRAHKDRRRGHVNAFNEYQNDLDAVLKRLTRDFGAIPWVLIGHSMGGAIVTRALMRAQIGYLPAGGERSGFVRGAILSAPMLQIAGGRAFITFARWVSAAASAIGLGKSYTAGGGPTLLIEKSFDGNVLTSDATRFAQFKALLKSNPELGLGDATWGWLHAALTEVPFLTPSTIPTLLAIGENDRVVSVKAAHDFAAQGDFVTLKILHDARHELFMETDKIQNALWSAIDAFFEHIGV